MKKNQKILTPAQKKRKKIELVLCAAIVVSMLIVRLILIDNGTIRTQDAQLSDEELIDILNRHEVSLAEDGRTGYATILSATPGRGDNADTAVIATGRAVMDSFTENETSITFPNADPVTGTVKAEDAEGGIGLISCEVEEQDSVYYSSNLYYQLEEGTTLYFFDTEENLTEATVLEPSTTADGYTFEMTTLSSDLTGEETGDALCGRGLYSASGYYIGTIEEVDDDGTILMVSGADVVELVKNNQ